jgi:hypothetical protein
MAVTVESLIQMRLISTLDLLKSMNITNAVELALEETLALCGFEGRKTTELSTLEKSYVADMTSAAIVRMVLDRYKEDAKAVLGGDGLVKEAQNKLPYLLEMLNRFEQQAKFLEGRLGIAQSGAVPPVVGKSLAKDESEGLS